MTAEPADLAAAAGIHRLSIPTPFLVGRVNCWLIEDDPLTLVDTGPNSGRSLDELEQALAAHRRRVEDLERIVVTHQHMDHEGLLAVLLRRSGAELCALDLLAPVLEDFGAAQEADDDLAEGLMRRHGVQEDVVTALRALARMARGWGASATVTRPLHDGGVLAFAGRTLQVLHRPGHSMSDTVLFDADRGVLFAGDHLLPRISSNPLISRPLGGRTGDPADPGRPRALPFYVASLVETAAMDGVEVVLPGHGDPFTDPADVIAQRLAMHERRADKLHKLLAQRGPLSAHDVAQALWAGTALTQAYLTLCEVLGHFDLLAGQGRVFQQPPGPDGVVRFRAV